MKNELQAVIKNNTSCGKNNDKLSPRKSSISSEIKTILSKVESSIPEVISMIEKTDNPSIQKTISEAIDELSMDGGQSTSSNITEDLAKELSDYSVKTIDDESTMTERKPKRSSSSGVQEMYKNHLIENVLRLQHQLSQVNSQEQMLEVEASTMLFKIAQKLEKYKGHPEKTALLKAKKAKTLKKFDGRKEELRVFKQNLEASEKEFKTLLKQRKLPKSERSLSSDESEEASSKTLKTEGVQQPVAKTPTVAAPLKAPLSPKSNHKLRSPLSVLRRRHSSADSDDSVSVVSQPDTDHSDMEIRIGALQEELKRRKATVATLKKQQADKHREKLRMQEDALKKQIESYDSLIEKTKAELIEQTLQGSDPSFTQPQIKSPKQSLDFDVESPVKLSNEAPSIESNYSDDFTSSSVSVKPSVVSSPLTATVTPVNVDPADELAAKTDRIVTKILTDLVADTGKALEKARAEGSLDNPPKTVQPPKPLPPKVETKSERKPQELMMMTAFDLGAEDSSTEGRLFYFIFFLTQLRFPTKKNVKQRIFSLSQTLYLSPKVPLRTLI